VPQRNRHAPGASRYRVGGQQNAHRLASLDHSLQPEPSGEWQPPHNRRRRFGEIQRNQAEAACLQHEIQRLDSAIDSAVPPLSTSTLAPWHSGTLAPFSPDPQQPSEINPASGCRGSIEHVQRVNERRHLSPARRTS
jgi:hypothetical protein